MKLFIFPFVAARDDRGRILIQDSSLRAPVRLAVEEAQLFRLRRIAYGLWLAWIAVAAGGLIPVFVHEMSMVWYLGAFVGSAGVALAAFRGMLRRLPEAGRLPSPELMRAFEIDVAETARNGRKMLYVGSLLLVIAAAGGVARIWFGAGGSGPEIFLALQGTVHVYSGLQLRWLARAALDGEGARPASA